MKFVAILIVLFVFVNLSEQKSKLINCPPDVIARITENDTSCHSLDCHGGSDSLSAVGCTLYLCGTPDKQIGYKEEDNSKVYPECCGGPICAD